MSYFDFYQNLETAVEKFSDQLNEKNTRNSDAARMLFRQNSFYSVTVNKEDGGFDKPIIIPSKYLKMKKDHPSISGFSGYKDTFQQHLKNVVFGEIFLSSFPQTKYIVDFNIPQIKGDSEISKPSDLFESSSVAQIEININRDTNDFINEKNTIAQFNGLSEELLDAAISYEFQFKKVVDRITNKPQVA